MPVLLYFNSYRDGKGMNWKEDTFVNEFTIFLLERGSSGESEAKQTHFGGPMKDIEVVKHSLQCC